MSEAKGAWPLRCDKVSSLAVSSCGTLLKGGQRVLTRKGPLVAKLNNKEREWVEARQRYGLTHAQVQMARELELIPRSLAKLTEVPVPTYVQQLYLERFGRVEPEVVVTIENRAKQEQKDNAMEKLARQKLGPRPKEPEPPPPKPQKRKKNRPHVSIPPRQRG